MEKEQDRVANKDGIRHLLSKYSLRQIEPERNMDSSIGRERSDQEKQKKG